VFPRHGKVPSESEQPRGHGQPVGMAALRPIERLPPESGARGEDGARCALGRICPGVLLALGDNLFGRGSQRGDLHGEKQESHTPPVGPITYPRVRVSEMVSAATDDSSLDDNPFRYAFTSRVIW
jgi:hypothetical protein